VGGGPSDRVAGIRISHPDRIIYPDLGVTKIDLVRFYETIGEWIVPHVAGRPLTLVHCPNGLLDECRYLRHGKQWGPSALRRVNIREKTKVGEYLVADDLAGVISLIQMGIVEIHTWNSTADDIERPNRIIWDLDPGPEIAFPDVVRAARTVREMLDVLKLRSWVKTTGGRGVHVVVPIAAQRDWSECLEFSRAIAEALERNDPRRFTTAFAKAGRETKILIDYLRNNRTNTSVCAYSTRARPGGAVSWPLTWEELTPRLNPQAFTAVTALRKLARRKDPWADYWKCRQRISDTVMHAVRRL
jgi:bifunctional non-homologous end joining protein LigD